MHTRKFQAFWRAYTATDAEKSSGAAHGPPRSYTDAREFLRAYGGLTFNHGLYRLHTLETSKIWGALCSRMLGLEGKSGLCFGFDWSGRQFVQSRRKDGSEIVLLLDPETDEVFVIPRDFVEFHDQELTLKPEPALAKREFDEWYAMDGRPLEYRECVGLRVPLRLGGVDNLSNRQRCDMEVYWAFQMQLLQQL